MIYSIKSMIIYVQKHKFIVDSLYAKAREAVKSRAALSASSFELISILGDITINQRQVLAWCNTWNAIVCLSNEGALTSRNPVGLHGL
jgi:hypothetical protein